MTKNHEGAPTTLLLTGVLLLAVLLRLWGGAHHPFVQDELYTLIDARLLLDSPLDPGIEPRPLYYLLQHLLLPLLPESEIGLRVLPLLFGVAGVWTTWVLAREVFDYRAAAVASLLAAISPWHLYISEMARYWSLVYLLITVFVLAYLKVDSGVDVRRWGWIGLAALALGTLSHPTFLFPVAGLFLLDAWKTFRDRHDRAWWARPAVRRIWLPYATIAAMGVVALFLSGEASTVQERTSRGLGPFLRLMPAVVQWMTPALFAGASVGVLAFLFSDRGSWKRWGEVALAGGGMTLILLMASAATSEVYTDYAVGLLPFAFVTLGGLVTALKATPGWNDVAGLGMVALMVFAVLPSSVSHVIDGTRFDLRPAFDFIRDESPDLPVYTSPIALQNHYADALDGRPLAGASLSDLKDAHEETAFWVVAPIRRYGLIHDSTGEKLRWLTEQCPEKLSYERPRFDYRMYSVRVFRCGSSRGD